MKRILVLLSMLTLFISPTSALALEDGYYNINNQKTAATLWEDTFEIIDPQGIEIEVLDMLSEIAGGYKKIMLLQEKENPNERVVMIDSFNNVISNIQEKALTGTVEGLESWLNLTNKLSEISEFSSEILADYEESSDYNYSFAILSKTKTYNIIYLVKDGKVIYDEILLIDELEEHNINY